MKKILLIDDDESIRESTQELLEVVGYVVKTAEDGAKGIKIAGEFIPDVIICDIAMPIMDGYAVLNELSKNPVTAIIPFIFMTARIEISDLKRGMHLGADDYICKPFSSSELLNSIELRLKKKMKILESVNNAKNFNGDGHKETKKFDKDSRIIVMTGNHPYNLVINSILYIESLEKYSKVFTTDGKKIIVRKLLKEWENSLPDDIFIRIHKTTIINLNYAKKFEKWFDYSYRVYLDKVEEPFIVSRRYSTKIRCEKIF
jgi:DNA-binding LytR/AlgR family response regulator